MGTWKNTVGIISNLFQMEQKQLAMVYTFVIILIGALILLFSCAVIFWLGLFFYINDLKVGSEDIDALSQKYKKILIIFPHADDEVLSMGGFLKSISDEGSEISWLLLTKGGKGNPSGTLDENLKDIRVKEAQASAKTLGIANLTQLDFPDGEVEKHKSEIKDIIDREINKVNPDLVLTFDLAGLYGHPDHVATSEFVTEVMKTQHTERELWYVSYPKRILDLTTLPERMANDPQFKNRRVYPDVKVWVGWKGVTSKTKAVYSYISQRDSYKSSFPIRVIPLWFYISLAPFEYFHKAN